MKRIEWGIHTEVQDCAWEANSSSKGNSGALKIQEEILW